MESRRRDIIQLAMSAALAGCARRRRSNDVSSSEVVSGAMRSRPLMTLRLTTAPTQEFGAGPRGARVTFPISGGTFEGDRLRGKVLPGGDDWTIKRGDGVIELDLRVTLETDDGTSIHMTFEGVRDDRSPGAPYFRTVSRFETAGGKYGFLNRLLGVGTAEIRAGAPVHVVEEIL